MRVQTLRAISAAFVAAALSACTPQVTVHGFVPSRAEVDSIEPGIDTILSIEDRIGRPSSSALLGDSDWYYVQTVMEQVAYRAPEVTNREVLAIGFDEDGVVADVQRYGLEDGRIINLSPRITRTGGQRRNALLALFGGLLRFDAQDLLGDG